MLRKRHGNAQEKFCLKLADGSLIKLKQLLERNFLKKSSWPSSVLRKGLRFLESMKYMCLTLLSFIINSTMNKNKNLDIHLVVEVSNDGGTSTW